MKKIVNYIAIISVSLLASSCTKVITLDLKDAESKLVIEANVTDNAAKTQFVKLTKTVPFSESSVYPVVSNANVIITDDAGQSETLAYTNNGIYSTTNLAGVAGRTYTLTIVADGKTYTATSKMPNVVNFDSIQINKLSFAGQVQNAIIPKYLDPIQEVNYYNFVLTVNGKLLNVYSASNDNLANGKQNQRPIGGPGLGVKSGDNVSIEMQCIDNKVYEYYYTLSQLGSNAPGGGTAPTNPTSNIQGGALGIFSAHTSQSKTIVIP